MEHIWTNMNNMNDLWQNMERLENPAVFYTGKPCETNMENCRRTVGSIWKTYDLYVKKMEHY